MKLQKYFYLAVFILSFIAISAQAQVGNDDKTGPNLVKNPGYELGSASWFLPDDLAKVVSDQAHSGKYSLYYKNTNKEQYVLFRQNINAKPGEQLDISAWVKGANITGEGESGAGLYVQAYRENNFINGSYLYSEQGTFGWTQLKGEYTVPPEATKVTVGIYLNRGVIGEAWFDDIEVRVRSLEPFQIYLQYPNYRGIIVAGDNTPWKSFVQINPMPDWSDSPIQITTILTDKAGKVLLEKQNAISANETDATVIFDPPRNLPLGKYTLMQRITDPNGKVQITKEHAIQVASKMPRVYVDKEGFTVVNGKRFFPLGVYTGANTSKEADMQRISEGGFNTVLSYEYGSGHDPQAYMERAAKHNLKVVYALHIMYPGQFDYGVGAYDAAAYYIETLKDNPALLAWYTSDEMEPEWLPKLQKMYDRIKSLDPNHPTLQVFDKLNELQKYFYVTDIWAPDPYPVGRDANLTKTSVDTNIAVEVSHQAQGVWTVSQIMDYSLYRKHYKPHHPSLNEMRNQAYQAIINGTKGLIWYSYYDLRYERYPRGRATTNMNLFLERWKDVSKMAHEIGQITPAILDNKKVTLDLPKDTNIQAGAWEQGSKLALLLANPYYETNSITFALPEGWIIKDANQGEIKSTFEDGKVTFTLPSVGSGVFYLVKA